MKRSNGGFNGPFFDWEGLQQQFFNEQAWKDTLRNGTGHMPWLEDYIKDLVSNVMPDAVANANKTVNVDHHASSLNFKVFETHTHIIAHIKLSPETDPKSIRILAGSNELLVKGMPEADDKRIILPARVRINGSRAVYKSGVFEVRMPREEEQDTFTELPVKYV